MQIEQRQLLCERCGCDRLFQRGLGGDGFASGMIVLALIVASCGLLLPLVLFLPLLPKTTPENHPWTCQACGQKKIAA